MAIVEGQLVKVKWHYSNKDWYIEKGYKFTKYGNSIEVYLDELINGSKVKIELKCDSCKINFHQNNNIALQRENHFCSRKCYYDFLKVNGSSNPKTTVKINCFNCDEEFEIKKYRYVQYLNGEVSSLCCSRKCQNEYFSKNNRGTNHKSFKPRLIINCQTCHKEFEIKEHRKNRAKYCSEKCRYIGTGKLNIPKKKHTIRCDNCDIEFKRWEHEINNYEFHFCSTKCRIGYQGHFLAKQQEKKDPTQCQIGVDDFLRNLNINFKNEVPFDYYAVDNYLPDNNLIIEVMGDYWHGNPMVYNFYESLNEMQKKRVKTDKAKKTHIDKKYGIKILYLWEKDVKENPEICEKLIHNYINNNGNLVDFNSYNYEIIKGELKIKKNIIKPYFMRSNTKRQVV